MDRPSIATEARNVNALKFREGMAVKTAGEVRTAGKDEAMRKRVEKRETV